MPTTFVTCTSRVVGRLVATIVWISTICFIVGLYMPYVVTSLNWHIYLSGIQQGGQGLL
jgi:hypothetical protein